VEDYASSRSVGSIHVLCVYAATLSEVVFARTLRKGKANSECFFF